MKYYKIIIKLLFICICVFYQTAYAQRPTLKKSHSHLVKSVVSYIDSTAHIDLSNTEIYLEIDLSTRDFRLVNYELSFGQEFFDSIALKQIFDSINVYFKGYRQAVTVVALDKNGVIPVENSVMPLKKSFLAIRIFSPIAGWETLNIYDFILEAMHSIDKGFESLLPRYRVLFVPISFSYKSIGRAELQKCVLLKVIMPFEKEGPIIIHSVADLNH
jgi:hypothetical protein